LRKIPCQRTRLIDIACILLHEQLLLLQRRTLNRIEYSINSLLRGLDIGKISLGMWSCYLVEYPHDCPNLWLDRRKSRNQITLSSLSQKIERQIKFFLVRMMDILDNAFLKVKLNLTKNIFTNPELIVMLRREKRLSISTIWQRLILSQARFFPLPSRVFVLIRLLAFVRR
jgi:hypothetical protein